MCTVCCSTVVSHKRRGEGNELMITKNNTVNVDDYWNSVNVAVYVMIILIVMMAAMTVVVITDSRDAVNNGNIHVNDYTVIMTVMILIIIIKSVRT